MEESPDIVKQGNPVVSEQPLPGNSQDPDLNMIPDEILESIPVEERGKVVSIFKQSMISGIMRRSNPIADKITPEHISKLIENSDEQDKRDRVERKGQQNYTLFLLITSLIFLGFLIVFLKNEQELLVKILLSIISFLGGFGLGKSRIKKEE